MVNASLPAMVHKGGLPGPDLIVLVGYLKGAGYASFSAVRRYYRDVVKISISRGQLAKVIRRITDPDRTDLCLLCEGHR